jgi:hypothetical protein
LDRLIKGHGEQWYWTMPGFASYGDAYDEMLSG